MPLPIKDLGPCSVTWGSEALGATSGGVIFRDEVSVRELKEDGHGDTPVDAVFGGRKVTVECNFTRSSLYQLGLIINGAVRSGTKLTVSDLVGGTMYSSAAELILKPLVNNAASATTTEWLHILKAYPHSAVEFGYNAESQRVYKVTFWAFPDQTTATLNQIYRMGPAS